jgi:hypothetical protein
VCKRAGLTYQHVFMKHKTDEAREDALAGILADAGLSLRSGAFLTARSSTSPRFSLFSLAPERLTILLTNPIPTNVTTRPDAAAIGRVKARREKEKDLDGIDASNIVEGGRRRAAATTNQWGEKIDYAALNGKRDKTKKRKKTRSPEERPRTKREGEEEGEEAAGGTASEEESEEESGTESSSSSSSESDDDDASDDDFEKTLKGKGLKELGGSDEDEEEEEEEEEKDDDDDEEVVPMKQKKTTTTPPRPKPAPAPAAAPAEEEEEEDAKPEDVFFDSDAEAEEEEKEDDDEFVQPTAPAPVAAKTVRRGGAIVSDSDED